MQIEMCSGLLVKKTNKGGESTLNKGESVEALFSTHKIKTTYWKDEITPVEGGGEQIFSTTLKDKVTWTPVK